MPYSAVSRNAPRLALKESNRRKSPPSNLASGPAPDATQAHRCSGNALGGSDTAQSRRSSVTSLISRKIRDPRLKFATDGSPGQSQDPRFWCAALPQDRAL